MNKVTDWDSLPVMLTPAEVQKVLQIGRNAVYDALNSGALPCIRLGRLLRIPKDELRAKLAGTPTPTA